MSSASRFLGTLALSLGLSACSHDITLIERNDTTVVIDGFQEPDKIQSLDVVAIVDTSCSMSGEKHDHVARSMSILRDDVSSITNDYQFMFMTTDANNLDVTGPLGANTTDLDLKMTIDLLQDVTGEAGFSAAYQYLTYEDVDSRDFADMLVFMFSDEPEQSSVTPTDFKDWILQKFPGKKVDIVTVSSWKTPADGAAPCGVLDTKYSELARLFGHTNPSDICDPSWEETAVDDSFLIHRIDRWELTAEPVYGSIVVEVDGVINEQWSYDISSNQVIFSQVPDYGSVVVIGYETFDDTSAEQ